jgi:hypothetical protein
MGKDTENPTRGTFGELRDWQNAYHYYTVRS